MKAYGRGRARVKRPTRPHATLRYELHLVFFSTDPQPAERQTIVSCSIPLGTETLEGVPHPRPRERTYTVPTDCSPTPFVNPDLHRDLMALLLWFDCGFIQ